MKGKLIIILSLLYSSVNYAAESPNNELLQQSADAPEEFLPFIFDVPLSARVEINGKWMGDALIRLQKTGTVQLLSFTDTVGSLVSGSVRDQWLESLGKPTEIGDCTPDKKCPDGLVALDFRLKTAQLTLVTKDAGQDVNQSSYYKIPESGPFGLIFRNNLNGSFTEGVGNNLYYNGDFSGSVGKWALTGSLQYSQYNSNEKNYTVPQVYGSRELDDGHAIRMGLFTPMSEGLYNRISPVSNLPLPIIGAMFGTSDTLLDVRKQQSASLYPIYVTPDSESVVEIYRNGSLLRTVLVQPGLQTLDTTTLPGGIYPVEVRIIRGGVESSRTQETIYKPLKWRNFERKFNYNIFAGSMTNNSRSTSSLGKYVDTSGEVVFGAEGEYLLLPDLQVGMMTQQRGPETSLGGTVDYTLNEWGNFYSTYSHETTGSNLLNSQLRFGDTVGFGSITLSYNRNENVLNKSQSKTYNKSLSWDKTLGDGIFSTLILGYNSTSNNYKNSCNDNYNDSYRISDNYRNHNHNNYNNYCNNKYNSDGYRVDLGLTVMSKIMGNRATWRVSGFDRPGGESNNRDSGIQLSLTWNIEENKRTYNLGLNSNNAKSGDVSDYSLTAGLNQNFDHEMLNSLGMNITGDKNGLGLSGSTTFTTPLAGGTSFVQMTPENSLSTGFNLSNTIAMGSGGVAMSGKNLLGDSMMIVDVVSDIPGQTLQAEDNQGSSTLLKPGRNLVEARPFVEGTQQYYFPGKDAPGALINPPRRNYHLNKGAVDYQKIEVSSTVSILGRILANDGTPLAGATVINHASRSYSEADGFFSMELSQRIPVLDIEHIKAPGCHIEIDIQDYRREGDVLFVGDLRCQQTVAMAPKSELGRNG
ncbi:CS1-pili formation C-terminal domain-containing protein [Buttiauxella ferragutiae]|uniref:CS1-pili formation C-terminal domain-containing protein n=1 Tax=Buttiauxella ferragutiae TaxID=82989 RepID=UPI001F5365BF|nr:CS1-pili formation C-terminal domain-containing protein [Buttiauxella ferragutiae]UNK62114.1 CS1-pili formation C-terminal domain-containing protein [Buttiauxella ferragutiae]